MNITKEYILQRLNEIAKQEEQTLADLNSLGGARQLCIELLNRIEEKDNDQS